ncbi:hypothetical protein DL96DRAFT_1579934 [Flagelloscypha sp. PMI_526]|nr:hypothetical protein DL96DRAFT_1579934 [Flagelloscypha sp. PMI_526]
MPLQTMTRRELRPHQLPGISLVKRLVKSQETLARNPSLSIRLSSPDSRTGEPAPSTPCLPDDVLRTVVEIAAAGDKQTALQLSYVSNAVSRWSAKYIGRYLAPVKEVDQWLTSIVNCLVTPANEGSSSRAQLILDGVVSLSLTFSQSLTPNFLFLLRACPNIRYLCWPTNSPVNVPVPMRLSFTTHLCCNPGHFTTTNKREIFPAISLYFPCVTHLQIYTTISPDFGETRHWDFTPFRNGRTTLTHLWIIVAPGVRTTLEHEVKARFLPLPKHLRVLVIQCHGSAPESLLNGVADPRIIISHNRDIDNWLHPSKWLLHAPQWSKTGRMLDGEDQEDDENPWLRAEKIMKERATVFGYDLN